MKYSMYRLFEKTLKMQFDFFAQTAKNYADMFDGLRPYSFFPEAQDALKDQAEASAKFLKFLGKDYTKPGFGVQDIVVDGKTTRVTETDVSVKPYGTLKHFERDTDRDDPKVVIIPPTSGHYSSTMKDVLKDLLPEHDVYIVDWENARDVHKDHGEFSLDDYIGYVQDFINEVGPDTHVTGFSQSTVPVMAAVSLMAGRDDDNQPISMTLMGGPINVEAEPTKVADYAADHSMEWFEKNVIMEVPEDFEGAGQRVYPGFMQLTGFMALHAQEHMRKINDLWVALQMGDTERAEEIQSDYDEYLAVSDLSAAFYLDTIQHVYKDFSLPRGTMTWQGENVDPSKITKTAMMTVAGTEDDIVAPKQTTTAHDLCPNLPQDMQKTILQDGAGHYDLCNGPSWTEDIRPQLTAFIREMSSKAGKTYDNLLTSKTDKNGRNTYGRSQKRKRNRFKY